MLSTIPIFEKSHYLCGKKTFLTLLTRTSWIDATHADRDKRFLQHRKAAPLAEDQTESGQARDHHHNHGRTATEDTVVHRTEGHLGSNAV